MKLKDIFEAAKIKKATKVFVNPADVEGLLPYPPIPVELERIIDMTAIGKGGGLNWYEDPSVQRGNFRVE